MKTANYQIQKNENLLRNVMSYLNCKDLSQVAQTSKHFNRITKNFNDYWKEECNSMFCSSYNDYKLIEPEVELNREHLSPSSHFSQLKLSPFKKSEPQWKEFMQIGVCIKHGWENFDKKSWIIDPDFTDDLITLRNELYSNLKEYFSMPKLRKGNHHVENDLNTALQTFLYDLLYDQQDLYEEYDEMMKNKKYQEAFIQVRQPDLPFAKALENYPSIVKEFRDEKDAMTLARLRWYMCFDETNEDRVEYTRPNVALKSSIMLVDENIFMKKDLKKEMTNSQMNDYCTIGNEYLFTEEKNSNCSRERYIPSLRDTVMQIDNTIFRTRDLPSNFDCYEKGIIAVGDNYLSSPCDITNDNCVQLNMNMIKYLQSKVDNRLLFTLNCLNLTVTHFCQLAYRYIMQYVDNDQTFLNEYVKRYKSFVEVSVAMNEFLENLNVIVNYSYEDLCDTYPTFPKFSIFRMMILTWNREVLGKLKHAPENSILSQKVINLYSDYLEKDFNDLNVNAKSQVSSHDIFRLASDIEKDYDFDNSSIQSASTLCSSIKTSINISTNANSLVGSIKPADTKIAYSNTKEDDFAFLSLIEQYQIIFIYKTFSYRSASAINDSSCHEYSVFQMNSTQIETNEISQELEDGILSTIERSINEFYIRKRGEGCNTKTILDQLIKYFQHSILHSRKFINRLKRKIFKKVTDKVCELCMKEISKIFLDEFLLKKNNASISNKDIEKYFKHFGNTAEKQSVEIYDRLMTLIPSKYGSPGDSNCNTSSYLVLSFIREYSKLSLSLINTFKEITTWFSEEEARFALINKQVEKEIKRRNIPSGFTNYQQSLLSLEKGVTWNLIKEVQRIENNITEEKSDNTQEDNQLDLCLSFPKHQVEVDGFYDINQVYPI